MGNSLTVFVRDYCANWVVDRCVGVDLQTKAFNATGQCQIIDRKSCCYFRQYVLPIARQKGTYEKLARLYRAYDSTFVKESIRKCTCGTELPRRRRYCEKCVRLHRQQTYRQMRHKRKKIYE